MRPPGLSRRFLLTQSALVEGKPLTQVNPAYLRIFAQLLRSSGAEDTPFIDDVCAIGHGKCLAHIVIGDQNPDSARFQVEDDLLQVEDSDRIDARKRLVEQDERGLNGRDNGLSPPGGRSPPERA